MALHDLEINLDLKQNLNVYANCKQLDKLHLIFNIFDDGVQADLSNYTVRLKAIKADNIPLIQDTEYSVVNNVVTIIAHEQLTTTTGATKIELQFINKTTGEKKATFNLNLKVIASTLEVERSISTATYTLLEQLENKLDRAEDIAESMDEAIEINKTLSTAITDAAKTKNALEIETGKGNTLKADLTKNITDGNIVNTTLENSITKGNQLKTDIDVKNIQAEANIKAMESFEDVTKLTQIVADHTTQLSEKANQNEIINGNFDFWQRGTAINNALVNTYLADRFCIKFGNVSSSVFPTNITHTKQPLSDGEIPKSSSHYRISVDGGGVFNGSDVYLLAYLIENGTRKLCGANQKITISFYARSSIPNKKIGLDAQQVYGTGGSPSTTNVLTGKYFNLTSAFTKYSVTLDTATLVGKTFGTNGDDYLRLNFVLAWGINFSTNVGDTIAETFRGAGYIDIAQIKVESGDKATPFIPRPYGEELALCQRYYDYVNALTGGRINLPAIALSSNEVRAFYNFKGKKRTTTSTVTIGGQWRTLPGGYIFSNPLSIIEIGVDGCTVASTEITALTANQSWIVQSGDANSAYIKIDAEIY
ncbi:hypothetical protein CLPUN_50780 [Clostridium puniceum]|uniref:BppU N-terminal domain-containing protein n=1 Tax=Clostridium puniceum TaxID=29367 RepID=A0A1S8SZZ5_9CLOT|nr:hypothetical protein [Clostridium puniceum]OOM71086.1 hypothetical protein CLPUN_50780 [Clostridium puniceum]